LLIIISNFNLSSSKKGEELKDSSLRILSIQEFKKLYQELNSIEFVQIGLDSNLNKKKSRTLLFALLFTERDEKISHSLFWGKWHERRICL
jgi:hypothetical protein